MNTQKIINVTAKLTGREKSLFLDDLQSYNDRLDQEINGKSVLVIGGAGTIGSSYIRALLHHHPAKLIVVDLNENGLAELVRDVRSSGYGKLPEIKTYPLSFGSEVFEDIFDKEGSFDIVANFAALKHVRSEKDPFAIRAMFTNNFILNFKLLELLAKNPPKHFFSVSTDKATNPVSIMGATKKLMEDVIFSYRDRMSITSARFANVAFSNGSLLDSFIHRFERQQPIVCPTDVKRFFVSIEESGQLCLIASTCGETGEIFVPKLSPEKDLLTFEKALHLFLEENGTKAYKCASDRDALLVSKSYRENPDNVAGYPVYLFETDTSGEKPYEEFFTADDKVDHERFSGLSVIDPKHKSGEITTAIVDAAHNLFRNEPSKKDIVDYLVKYVDGFSYIERGKTLDEKM